MSKFKIFIVLLFSSVVWAVPFNIEVVKTGDGDEIRAGQLIKVHYKGYLYADMLRYDSLKVVAAQDSSLCRRLRCMSLPRRSCKADERNRTFPYQQYQLQRRQLPHSIPRIGIIV